MKAYHYNILGVYTGICEAYEDPLEPNRFVLPASATFIAPPPFKSPFVPDIDGEKWSLLEDHRKQLGKNGKYEGGTPYWLPEDNWQAEARYMTSLGSLPEGAILTKPEKTATEIRKEEIEEEIREAKAYLESTDYVPLKIIEEPETAASYAEITKKRKTARSSIDPLMTELATL